MNKNTTLILGIGVIAAAAAVYFLSGSTVTTSSDSVTEDRALVGLETSDVKRFEMASSDRPSLVFESNNKGEWQIVEPIKAPADKMRVMAEVRRIAELRYYKKFDKGAADRPGDDTTHLAQPYMVVKLTDQKGKVQSIRIGSTALLSTRTYVSRDGDDAIYLVDSELSKDINSRLAFYRNAKVVDFATANASRISLHGSEKVTLTRTGKSWAIDEPIKARARQSVVSQLLAQLSILQATKFVDDTPANLAIYGLDKPAVVAEVEIDEQRPIEVTDGPPSSQPEFETVKRTVRLELGATVNEAVFAKLGGEDTPWVFQLPESVLQTLSVDLDKLRDDRVIDANVTRATKIVLTSADGSVELNKDGEFWYGTLPGGDAADRMLAEYAAVDDLLRAVRDLKAVAFERTDRGVLPDFGFEQGTSLEIFVAGDVATAKLSIGRSTPAGTGVYVRNDNEQGVAVVKPEAVQSIAISPLAFVDRKLTQFARALADRIEIERDGNTWVLEKAGSGWSLKTPVNGTAEHMVVQNMLADTSALMARRVVAMDGDLARFGLDQPLVRCTIRVTPTPPASQSASAPVNDTHVESSDYVILATRHDGKAYAAIEGEPKIGEVDDKIVADLMAEPLLQQVMELDTTELSSVELISQDHSMRFDLQNGVWRLENEPGFKGNELKLKGVADKLAGLRTSRYVVYSEADPAAYGLDEPALRVIIRAGALVERELLISTDGPADGSGRRYAMIKESGRVFLIESQDIASFQGEVSDFEQGAAGAPGGAPAGMGGFPGMGG